MRFILTLMAMAVLAVSVGCDKKPEKTPEAKPAADAPAGDTDGAATSKSEGTQSVSLKLPGMT